MGRGAWLATVHGVTKSRTRLSHFHFDTYQRQLLGALLYIYIHIQFLLFLGCTKQYAGYLFPNQGSNPSPLCGSTESQPPDHQGSPGWCFSTISNLYMISWRRQWHPTPVLFPGKSHEQRSLVGCSPWGRKSRTQLSNFTFTFHFHALEKGLATHSSVLAWRIPGTGEPDGLPSIGSHRVGHD